MLARLRECDGDEHQTTSRVFRPTITFTAFLKRQTRLLMSSLPGLLTEPVQT
jgi:hypothetical protein